MVYPPWNRVGVCWGGCLFWRHFTGVVGGGFTGEGCLFWRHFTWIVGGGYVMVNGWLSVYHEHLLKNMAVTLHEIG